MGDPNAVELRPIDEDHSERDKQSGNAGDRKKPHRRKESLNKRKENAHGSHTGDRQGSQSRGHSDAQRRRQNGHHRRDGSGRGSAEPSRGESGASAGEAAKEATSEAANRTSNQTPNQTPNQTANEAANEAAGETLRARERRGRGPSEGPDNSTCADLDEETKFMENWEETQKRIYDPTIGLRRHYTNELLSCGEKNNIRVLEKWSSMINRDINWFMKTHRTTFLRRVKRGIPQKYRWKVWFQITNSKILLNKFQKKYYFLSKKKSNYTNLIMIDISRTFPELLIFDKYAQEQLFRILNAYSNFEPSVGYCQGMNFLVGLLLIVSNFNEIETFCVLVSLMNNYHLKEFYKEKFPLLNRYIYLFEKILQCEVPDLVDHFNREEVFPPVYLHQWLLTLFIASLPIKSVIVIWDYLFSTSIKTILIISVALLKILKSYLMKHKFEKILKLLKSLKYNESNDDILIAKLLIKKSESVNLNPELSFLFDNIEREDIPFDGQFKFFIGDINNCHFTHVEEQAATNGKAVTDGTNKDQTRTSNWERPCPATSTPGSFTPGSFSPGSFSPGSFSPGSFSPVSFTPSTFSPSNFVALDGVPLLNFFSNRVLKRDSKAERQGEGKSPQGKAARGKSHTPRRSPKPQRAQEGDAKELTPPSQCDRREGKKNQHDRKYDEEIQDGEEAEQTARDRNMNTFYYKILSSNEKNLKKKKNNATVNSQNSSNETGNGIFSNSTSQTHRTHHHVKSSSVPRSLPMGGSKSKGITLNSGSGAYCASGRGRQPLRSTDKKGSKGKKVNLQKGMLSTPLDSCPSSYEEKGSTPLNCDRGEGAAGENHQRAPLSGQRGKRSPRVGSDEPGQGATSNGARMEKDVAEDRARTNARYYQMDDSYVNEDDLSSFNVAGQQIVKNRKKGRHSHGRGEKRNGGQGDYTEEHHSDEEDEQADQHLLCKSDSFVEFNRRKKCDQGGKKQDAGEKYNLLQRKYVTYPNGEEESGTRNNSRCTSLEENLQTKHARLSKERKSLTGSLKRHAYYYNQSDANNEGYYYPYRENSAQRDEGYWLRDDDNPAENLITGKVKQFEKKMNEEEEQEISNAKELRRKKGGQRAEGMRKKKKKKKKKDSNVGQHGEDGNEEDEIEEEDDDEEEEEEESIFSISQYINPDDSEKKQNSEEKNNGLGIFNLIHSYAKDSSWFDVSSINKYYQFGKTSGDMELDDINADNERENKGRHAPGEKRHDGK
ncbi:GTPase-activating protein, putative [Plasmodium vivax]|uniref:GTPase-activating protein, putative n=1 Tax=Plasmodium vivax TaxID=5855 RepID=A0A1G4GUY1_PLAVI|nr:GTPase-activating protein, putative [Plasmodium vivax]